MAVFVFVATQAVANWIFQWPRQQLFLLICIDIYVSKGTADQHF
jgi:hypothetical protein